MQSYVLLGSFQKQQEYLKRFKADNNISGYLIVSYDPFKISDARLLQKAISAKLRENEKRLITIENPTLEAQHAILKTVEELPESSIIFFLAKSKEELLPTIQSRCFLLNLEYEQITSDPQLEQKILEITNDKSSQRIFELIDSLDLTIEASDIEKLIISLRGALLNSINKQTENAKLLHKVVQNLSKNYNLVKSNNINRRAAVENAFLE